MFYYNARYRFALPQMSPTNIPGTIIAASAMPAAQLLRRKLSKYSHLRRRLFDPQLYLASLDPHVAEKSVVKLCSWPWFATDGVPEYDSDRHGSLSKWKKLYKGRLLRAWTGNPPSHTQSIEKAISAAVQNQVRLGCEAVILPGPLTTVAAQDFEVEINWIDIGLQVCRALQISLPIYATVALSDNILRGVNPIQHSLIHTITNHIGARNELSGAYIVIEQSSEDGYACTTRETVLALLLMTDDIVRGAGRRVIVNYMGTLGAVVTAAGLSLWSTGYYLSQRRLSLTDFEEKVRRAKPRYFSQSLAGDIGLDSDLADAYRAGLGNRILSSTQADTTLRNGLATGSFPGRVPEWQFRTSNLTAAAAHYNENANTLGTRLYALGQRPRIDFVHDWLRSAVALADRLRKVGLVNSHYTELVHQRVWLNAYEAWRNHAGL